MKTNESSPLRLEISEILCILQDADLLFECFDGRPYAKDEVRKKIRLAREKLILFAAALNQRKDRLEDAVENIIEMTKEQFLHGADPSKLLTAVRLIANSTRGEPTRFPKGTRIYAKINGGTFKSSVVEDFGETVRVHLAGDCDREIPRTDVEITHE